MLFDQWMESVDVGIQEAIGVSYKDLPDQCYRAWYDDGLEPADAVQSILEEEGLDVY